MLIKKINRLYYIKDNAEVNIPSEPEDPELYYFPKEVALDRNIRVFKELYDGTKAEIPRYKRSFDVSAAFKVLGIIICFMYLIN